MKDGVIFRYKNGHVIPIKVGDMQSTNEYMNNKLRNNGKQANINKELTYQLTDDNIQQVIDESISQWDDNYARLYMTRISPEDFLNLTTNETVMNWLEAEKFDLDVSQLDKSKYVADMMYLDIDLTNGAVVGHEGRHRALALKNAGYKKVDIVVFPHDYDKYNAKEYKDFKITSQENIIGYKNTTLEKLVPVSKANVERIKKRDY